MTPASQRNMDSVLAVTGLFAASPAIYFFFGNLLKYRFDFLPDTEILVPPPFVMVGGLLLAVLLNLVSLYSAKAGNGNEKTPVSMVKLKPVNILVLLIALLTLVLLLGYVLVENILERGVV